jgi:hypothetical protein
MRNSNIPKQNKEFVKVIVTDSGGKNAALALSAALTIIKRLVTLIEPSFIMRVGCSEAFVVNSLLSTNFEIDALAS